MANMLGGASVAAPASPDAEVRQCAQCKECSVVVVFTWNAGNPHTEIRDYRCQNCGARFSIHPKVQTWTYIIIGIVLGWAVFPLGFTIFGWWRLRRNTQNPIAPFAPRPVMKYRDGPPRRRCGTCGQPVNLTRVTRRSSRGMPTGTEYEYVCVPCNQPFVIESVWGHCVSFLSAGLVAVIAGAFLVAGTSPGWRFGGGGIATLLAGFLVVQSATRISNHYRYPVIDG